MKWWKRTRSSKPSNHKSTTGCTSFSSSSFIASKESHLQTRNIVPDAASLQLDDRVQSYLNQINSRQVCGSGLRLGETRSSGAGRHKSSSVGNVLDLAIIAAEENRSSSSYLHFSCAPLTPAVCSICNKSLKHFGRPTRRFSYEELEQVTKKFCQDNFVAEGESEFVYKGLLPDYRRVAVKTNSHEDKFWAEIETLSTTLHPNVVTLIGFCVEEQRRLLVYDFICNGSLEWHLSHRNPNTLEWDVRQKIAVNTAKSLRYLHEQCRPGCIVHRDIRSKNIFLTHDYEPVIGGFGFARWQVDATANVKGSVVGTPGYLAPEYAESGQISGKVDVYSFGVVLLELISGRKAVDFSRPILEQQFLIDWARPLLGDIVRVIREMVDIRLGAEYHHHELYCMVNAASLCIQKDPTTRPNISQVLCILEGENVNACELPISIPENWYNNKKSSSLREHNGALSVEDQYITDLRYPSSKLSSSSSSTTTSSRSSVRLPAQLHITRILSKAKQLESSNS